MQCQRHEEVVAPKGAARLLPQGAVAVVYLPDCAVV